MQPLHAQPVHFLRAGGHVIHRKIIIPRLHGAIRQHQVGQLADLAGLQVGRLGVKDDDGAGHQSRFSTFSTLSLWPSTSRLSFAIRRLLACKSMMMSSSR